MPAVVASAPGRVNLIGEHTDYNGGLCLPVALPQRTTVTLAPRDDLTLRLTSAQEDQTWEGRVEDHPGGWAAYVAGVVQAMRDDGHAAPGLDASVDSEVPVGAGLSSSAALECAVATGVAALVDLDLADRRVRRGLAQACIRAENEYVGAPTGGMDQTVAMLAEPGHALLLDFADGSATPVELPLDGAGLVLLVIDTRVSHALTDGGYGNRRQECAEAAGALGVRSLRDASLSSLRSIADPVLRRRARHVVTENLRVLSAVGAIGDRSWEALAAVLDASHVSMRDDFEISCRELDLAVETARTAGALGARMTGGGFGGSAVALVPRQLSSAVQDSVLGAFRDAGLTQPACYVVTPGEAARLESGP
ncbi:MAG TPA: galactokinase [Nocardioides sp.]|uniref:galactokinase n=1 Tax=Nocardioides sp. TaxID=35761 RepID=UPI002E38115D|nr:galactokinase [Nocardioides sp.]HEX3931606.1 galactokinase [Nocardioides sp.]